MLPIKIFLQFAAVASSFAGCYALTSYTIKSITKNDLFEYFLVDAVVATTNKEDENLFSENEKNYKCELNEKKHDDDCKLFKLSSEALTSGAKNKTVHLPSLINEDSLLKEKIKAETYILKLSQNSIYKEIFTSTIVLKSLKNTQNSFASLTINQHLKSSNQETKSSFATVKYVLAGTLANTYLESKEFLCDIGKEKAIPCSLKAFEKVADFYTFEKATVPTTIQTIALNQYFLLEIQEANKTKTSAQFKESPIKIVEKTDTSKTVGTFVFEELILKNNKETNSSPYFPIVESKTWLVTSTLGSNSRVHEPLLTSDSWQKNYKCKVSGLNKELDCDLYLLNYAETRNSSSFTNTKYWQKEAMAKTETKKKTFFKLKINSYKLPNIKLDGSQTIQLINKTSKGVYATLSPEFEMKLSYFYGNKNLMFGTVGTALTGDSSSFKCKLPGKEENLPCDIYKFTETATDVSSSHFSTTKKVSKASEVTATTKFVLDLKNQKLIATSPQQTIAITVEANGSPTAQFTVVSELIGIMTSTPTKNQVIETK